MMACRTWQLIPEDDHPKACVVTLTTHVSWMRWAS